MTVKLPCLTCGVLTPKSYCPNHIPAWVTRAHRPSPTQRGYDKEYRTNRKILLESNPNCNRCGTLGTPDNPMTADHIVSLSNGGSSHLDNLQPLCRRCNSRKK